MGFTTTYTSVTWTTGDTLTEAKLDNMVANDQAYDSHATQGLELDEMSKPSTPTNAVRLYAKDDSGTSKFYVLQDDGTEIEVGAGASWTAWATWSPSYSASGSMTFTSVTTHIARYCQIEKIVYFQIRAIGTTGGTASNSLFFSLPSTPAITTDYSWGGGCIAWDTGGNIQPGWWCWDYATSKAEVHVDATNWSLGASTGFIVQGFYEVS